jgi:hypothetical protein
MDIWRIIANKRMLPLKVDAVMRSLYTVNTGNLSTLHLLLAPFRSSCDFIMIL